MTKPLVAYRFLVFSPKAHRIVLRTDTLQRALRCARERRGREVRDYASGLGVRVVA
jgi:ribosomal protein L19